MLHIVPWRAVLTAATSLLPRLITAAWRKWVMSHFSSGPAPRPRPEVVYVVVVVWPR